MHGAEAAGLPEVRAHRSGRAGELARAFVFCLLCLLPFWLYILRLFRLFRLFSINLSGARYFLKIGGNFALCWRAAVNQGGADSKKQAEHLLRLPFIGVCVSFSYQYIARATSWIKKHIYKIQSFVRPSVIRPRAKTYRGLVVCVIAIFGRRVFFIAVVRIAHALRGFYPSAPIVADNAAGL